MARNYHTIIVVPHARAKLRKWHLSTTQLRVAAASLAFLVLAALFLAWAFFSTNIDSDQLTALRQENEQLRQVNQSFEGNIRDLQAQLEDYAERARQLSIVAGLSSVGEDGEAGIGGREGGPAGSTSYLGDLGSLENRSRLLGDQLDAVEERLTERLRWIASTPSISPVRGLMTSGFGYRTDPIDKRRAFHPAVDISAPPGQPVSAPAAGVVLRAERIGGLGRAVYLAHGFGIVTRYGHLSEIDVEAGDRVERGELLGKVGATGRATGYHLHYEVHVDGKAVNPIEYMLDRDR